MPIPPSFKLAVPVWAAEDPEPRYATAGFRSIITGPGAGVLRMAGNSAYRVWLNGKFLFHGPARCAKGHFRLDEIPLSLSPGENLLAIEVVGYGVNAFSHIDQPPFLSAEVEVDGVVVSATGASGFVACRVPGRSRRMQRYSYMRPMSEVYRLAAGWDAWRTEVEASIELLDVGPAMAGPIHPRRTENPDFARFDPIDSPRALRFELAAPPEKPRLDRSVTHIGTELTGYPREEWDSEPWFEMQRIAYSPNASKGAETHDFGVNRTGLIGLHVEAAQPGRIVLAFDEIAENGIVNPHRLGCVNLVELNIEPGEHEFLSFEPYTFRYLTVLHMEGAVQVTGLHLREFSHPAPDVFHFESSEPALNTVVTAAVETLRQNSVDLFMDCPHRERGGYLCDSFFTARAYQLVFGHTAAEDAFLENYLVAEQFETIPQGMVPMCYPSDPLGGTYIPQWGMWLVVQLADYARRGGDSALIEAFRPRLTALLEYLRQFENEEGLLESMPGWNFVEWSDANKWVQDVNFPTNMLYAQVLIAVDELYGLLELKVKGERVLESVRRLSFNGRFFIDNALRTPKGLELTVNHSEVCQYFAFFFGAATPETHSTLWHELQHTFGPDRKKTGAHPDVAFANAFIGNVLRLELLPPNRLERELLGYFQFMAQATGTLWENDGPYASCNHGFASYAAVITVQKVLGIRLDYARKVATRITVQTDVESCAATLPTPDGPLHVERKGKQVLVKAPPGWHTD